MTDQHSFSQLFTSGESLRLLLQLGLEGNIESSLFFLLASTKVALPAYFS